MYLGIDLGTSGIKTVLLNDQQQMIATTSASLTVTSPSAAVVGARSGRLVAGVATMFNTIIATTGSFCG